MVQANELRIGNCVSLNGKQVIVKDIPYLVDDNKEGYLINEVWADEYEPIPLTPEILAKHPIPVGRDKGGLIADMISGKEIKFLHQYQNVVFALTGEELTVNIL
jgi:hypothetical protein